MFHIKPSESLADLAQEHETEDPTAIERQSDFYLSRIRQIDKIHAGPVTTLMRLRANLWSVGLAIVIRNSSIAFCGESKDVRYTKPF
jgi:hypothetical protein